MFERYTESARRALFFARYEVSLVGATSIEPEHLLVGAARAAKGGVATILEDSGLSADGIRQEIAAGSAPPEEVPMSLEVPFSASMQRVLHFSAEEADALAHGYIGIEHLLLGVLRIEGSTAAAILDRHGVKLNALRTAVQAMSSGPAADGIGDLASEIDRLQALVDSLASLSADSGEARDVRRRIRERLEQLKRHLRR
jgi:ATP-dependent Clp protease ATP-binding subunit ClpC